MRLILSLRRYTVLKQSKIIQAMKIKVLVCDFILNPIRWIILYFLLLWHIEIFGCFANHPLTFTHFTSIEHVYKYRTVIHELVTIVTGFYHISYICIQQAFTIKILGGENEMILS